METKLKFFRVEEILPTYEGNFLTAIVAEEDEQSAISLVRTYKKLHNNFAPHSRLRAIELVPGVGVYHIEYARK